MTTETSKVAATGNLPSNIADTAVVYASRSDFSAKPADGFRWSFVGYKATKSNPNPPANFAIQVKVQSVDSISVQDDGDKFIVALFEDYQDSVIHASADKETLVNPTSVSALIADYFSTERGGVKRVDVMKWYDDVFAPVFATRQIERAAELGTSLKPQQVELIVAGYRKYVSGLCAKSLDSCGVTIPQQRAVRQTIERLCELELLDAGDVMVQFILGQVKKFSSKAEDVIDASV